MIGWLVAWKCLVACLFFEESQQPTCPHVRQSRRWTQVSPIFKQSSHPLELGVTSRIWSRWRHCCAMCLCFLSLMLLDALASFRKDHMNSCLCTLLSKRSHIVLLLFFSPAQPSLCTTSYAARSIGSSTQNCSDVPTAALLRAWQQKRLQHPPLFLKDCIPASSIAEVHGLVVDMQAHLSAGFHL